MAQSLPMLAQAAPALSQMGQGQEAARNMAQSGGARGFASSSPAMQPNFLENIKSKAQMAAPYIGMLEKLQGDASDYVNPYQNLGKVNLMKVERPQIQNPQAVSNLIELLRSGR